MLPEQHLAWGIVANRSTDAIDAYLHRPMRCRIIARMLLEAEAYTGHTSAHDRSASDRALQ